ncbi:cystatin-B-like isoform X1 [Hippocampus comes]|uniref:Cystatin-B n=1 Tax=Hippocampus comes TaxID=109280 RepID=A0A3Q3DXE7_HIPCM|nr:PREDICTED: cystatin-B-like isoform X1 [Hippocampus comes]
MTTFICPMYGGLSDVTDANEVIQEICDHVKSRVEQKTGKAYTVFTAKSCRSQIIAGTNYFIKVHVGGNDHVHLRVYQSLSLTGTGPELISIKEFKTHDDEIEYFE